MSGSIFGQVTPIQVPDYARTRANYLAMLTQQRQLDEQDARQNFFAQHAQGFASSDPAKRMNLLAMLMATPGGANMALPMMQSLREEMDFMGTGQGAAAAQPTRVAAAPASGAVQPAVAPADLMPLIEEASRETGVPVPILVAQIRQESNFDPNARGRAGEIGLAQIMPATARNPGFGLPGVDPARLSDPRENILFGARYLAARGRAAGVTDWNDPAQVDRALAAYNGGGDPNYVQNVRRWLPQGGAGSDTIPTSGGATRSGAAATPTAGPVLQRTPSGRIVVPGFDMDRVERAYSLPPSNRMAQQYIERYERALTQHMQALQMERRGESEPLERVRRPDGSEVFVPRSQAAGMVSAPAPRETPNPLGANAPAAASQTIRNLNSRVADGTATADEVALWRDAVEVWTSETRNPDGSVIPGRALSPETRAAAAALASREGRTSDAAPVTRPGEPPPPRTEPTVTGGERTIRPVQVSPQDRERWAKIETDSGRVVDAIRGFREALDASGGTGLSAYLNNPQDPAAVRINTAFSNLVTALRGEAFLNTGVLQPGEIALIDRMLLNPQTMRGLFASRDAYNALLNEITAFIDRGLDRQRRVVLGQGYAGNEGDVPTPGPGGRGTAEPPPPAAPTQNPTVRRYNPRTGRIE
jgi:soluble lytic murein transglycosylase-like protein